MKKQTFPRVRGIVSARAEVSLADINAAVGEINRTFAAFREQNDRRLADLEHGREEPQPYALGRLAQALGASVPELAGMAQGMAQASMKASA